MVLSIWKHNFVCCMPETKSNVIPLAYLPTADEKTAEFWLLLLKFKNIASVLFTPKNFAYIKKIKYWAAVAISDMLCMNLITFAGISSVYRYIFQWVNMQPVKLKEDC